MSGNAYFLSWAGALVMALLLISAYPAFAGIQASAHDFSQNLWSQGEICNVCHTPHNANAGSDAPLWNHEVSTETYTLYTSPTLKFPTEQPGPGNVSRMCLSCHDGTIAIDSFGGDTGSTMIADRARVGTDLSNDHPIGVRWEHQTFSFSVDCLGCHALVWDPNSYSFVFGGQPGGDLKFFNRKVECPSCHDAHNNRVRDQKMLRMPMAGSELCQHCHFK